MVVDIYQTPKSDLQLDQDRIAGFYVVSLRKFIILYTATLGLYGVYWFYKHWSLYKSADKTSVYRTRIWPIPRTIFSIFFAHSLFGLIYRQALEIDQSRHWRPNVYATIYVIFDIVWSLSEALRSFELSATTIIVIDLISMVAIGWTLSAAQIYANIACADVAGKSNSHITFANYIWILSGMLMWVLYAFVILLEAGLVDFGLSGILGEGK